MIKELKKLLKKHSKIIFLFLILAVMISAQPVSEKKETLSSWGSCNVANLKESSDCEVFPSSITSNTNNKCMNIKLLGGPEPVAAENCLANYCFIGEYIRDWDFNEYVCAPCVADGLRATSIQACCNDGILNPSGESADGYDYLCRGWPPGTDVSAVSCNDAEKTIASFLQGVIPGLGCKTSYWLTVIGGGFIALFAVSLI